jgi:hypothetical protein
MEHGYGTLNMLAAVSMFAFRFKNYMHYQAWLWPVSHVIQNRIEYRGYKYNEKKQKRQAENGRHTILASRCIYKNT